MAESTTFGSTKVNPPSSYSGNRQLSPAPDAGQPLAPSDTTTYTQPYPNTPDAGDMFADLDNLTSNPNTNPIRSRTKVPDTSSLRS